MELCVKASRIPCINEKDVNSKAERCKAAFWLLHGQEFSVKLLHVEQLQSILV